MVAGCRFCLLFLLLAFLSAAVHAQSTTQPADVEAEIRAILPDLLDSSKGPAAVEKLTDLRDAKVLLVFQRIADNSVYTLGGQMVHVTELKPDESGRKVAQAYDLFAPIDAQKNYGVDPLRTVTDEDLKGKEFYPARPVRNRINNALRLLGLKVTDPAIRRQAARDIGNRRQPEALEELRKLAHGDPDPLVRHEAKQSVAIIVASGADPTATPEQKLAAVKELGELDSIRAMDLLKEDLAKLPAAAAERQVYQTSISQIETHLTVTDWIKNGFFGLSAGSILVLLALGLAITFGLMGVINMAHGEMMMIGAVTTWACFEFIGKNLPAAWFDWYYVIAFPAAFATAAGVGLLIELLIVRFLYKRPLDSMLATIGVSYILIQAVRLWKGDNLGLRKPSWSGGGWEVMPDVVLAYDRLFLIALAIFCVASVIVLFRYTRLGLMIRATVQNREMAQALGVNTRLVDMVTFAFGAGLAGLAGYGIVLIANPTPEMGTGYIVRSFLTVVVGGVGKLAGVIVSGLGLGFLEKFLEPIVLIEKPLRIFDATWAQVATLLIVILFMQRRPAGLFPEKGRSADQADRSSAPLLARTGAKIDILLAATLCVIGLVFVPALYGGGFMSLEFVNKLGYILTFAICAIGLDLIWGYIGVLSLCQFLFFSIGGYCMGLYLINHGPMTADGIPLTLSYVMSDVGTRSPPWFLPLFRSFPGAIVLGMLLPALLALLIGVTTFRSRVRGVYFAILTQAITVAAWLVFQKNDLKLGGTNGLTNFTQILSFPIASDRAGGPFEQTRFWLYIASFVCLMLVILVAKILVSGGFGRVLVAIRDDETRLRFAGYQSWTYKAAAFTLAAAFAGLGGMLYVPQKGIITPHQIAAGASILVVAWVAVGGRGSLWGSVFGAIAVSLLYEYMTSWKPDYWLFILGGLFVIVPLLLPGGLMSLPLVIWKLMQPKQPEQGFPVSSPVSEGGAS